jgi:hypothetical protein
MRNCYFHQTYIYKYTGYRKFNRGQAMGQTFSGSPEFDHGTIHVGFVVDKASNERNFLRGFPCQCHPPHLNTHNFVHFPPINLQLVK